MARLIGGFIVGKLGNDIYYVWKGKQKVRKYNAKVKNPNTPLQQANRQKLVMATRLGSRLKQVVRVTYQGSKKESQYNEFVSHVYRSVISGEFPDYVIDYTILQVARGNILAPRLMVAEKCDNNLVLSWYAGFNENGRRQHDDRMALLLINSAGEINLTYNLATRIDEKAKLQLPENFKSNFHAWAFYTADIHGFEDNRNNVSGSVYLGSF